MGEQTNDPNLATACRHAHIHLYVYVRARAGIPIWREKITRGAGDTGPTQVILSIILYFISALVYVLNREDISNNCCRV